MARQRYRIPPDSQQVLLPFASADPFGHWADRFFRKQLNEFVPVKEAFESFVKYTKTATSRLQFKRALTAWCFASGYELDPLELRNAENRIIRKKEVSRGVWKAMEMIYVKEKK